MNVVFEGKDRSLFEYLADTGREDDCLQEVFCQRNGCLWQLLNIQGEG